MFKVKYKYDNTGKLVYTVCAVHKDDDRNNTFFLIYNKAWKKWEWVLADNYAPYIAEE